MQAKLNDTSEIKLLKALDTRASIKNYVEERGGISTYMNVLLRIKDTPRVFRMALTFRNIFQSNKLVILTSKAAFFVTYVVKIIHTKNDNR